MGVLALGRGGGGEAAVCQGHPSASPTRGEFLTPSSAPLLDTASGTLSPGCNLRLTCSRLTEYRRFKHQWLRDYLFCLPVRSVGIMLPTFLSLLTQRGRRGGGDKSSSNDSDAPAGDAAGQRHDGGEPTRRGAWWLAVALS